MFTLSFYPLLESIYTCISISYILDFMLFFTFLLHNSGYFNSVCHTSALDGGEWSVPCPWPHFAPGEDPRYPLDRRLGGPQNRSGHRC
jgi:hypothetical protein